MHPPFLSLKDIDLNPQLAARIPAYLAYYHQVIPVAEEDEQLTLWMVYPDNPKVVRLFVELLGQPVFPVRGSQEDIRQALDHLYERQAVPSAQKFLNWSGQQDAADLARVFHVELIDVSHLSFDALMNRIQQEPQTFSLVGIEWAATEHTRMLLQEVPLSLLLMRGQYPVPRKILVVLQGHSPDLQAVQTGLQIAGFHQARITVLGIAAPMKRHQIQGIAALLDSDTKAGQHVQKCLALVQNTGIEGFLKLRQGIPQDQVAHEFIEGGYDLMVIPVETFGDFVYRVLEQIDTYAPQHANPILAVKPSR